MAPLPEVTFQSVILMFSQIRDWLRKMLYKNYIRDLLDIVMNKSNKDTLKGYIIRGSFGSFAIKIINIFLIFAYSFVLVRILGAEEYGIYEYVIAWVNLLIIPLIFGLDRLSIKIVSASVTQENWGQIRGLIRGSIYTVITFSILIIFSIFIVTSMSDGEMSYSSMTLWMGTIALPITALTMIWEGFLRGLHRVLGGQMPILIIRPGIAILFFIAIALFTAIQLNAFFALVIYNFASFCALLTSMFLLARHLPPQVTIAEPVYEWKEWFTSALPLMLMGGMIIVTGRLGTIFLGANQNPEGAGIFALIFRMTNLITFAQVAVGVVISPTIASLFAARDMGALQKVTTQSVLLIFVVSLPFALGLLIFGDWILLVFGEEFTSGVTALRLLIIADIINIATGNVGVTLAMTGFERDALIGFIIGVIVNFVCCIFFVPWLGVTGAALALALSNVVWNFYLAYIVHKRLGIFSSIFGGFFYSKTK
ncbi:MAG: oligosaccharide flippase family protein [Anaerolineae bacterium]